MLRLSSTDGSIRAGTACCLFGDSRSHYRVSVPYIRSKQLNKPQKNCILYMKVKVKSLSRARLLATPWTGAYEAPPSMGFSRQEYWSGLPLPSPGDLPDPGIKPGSPALEADTLTSEPPGKPLICVREWTLTSLKTRASKVKSETQFFTSYVKNISLNHFFFFSSLKDIQLLEL